MKKILPVLGAICTISVFALVGCGGGNRQEIVVSATAEQVELKDTEVSDYDYTSLFTITVDGESVAVLSEYVNSSAVSEAAGSYDVTCTYQTKNASVKVVVSESVRTLELLQEHVTLRLKQVKSFDFNALFEAKVNGKKVEITGDMVETDVAEALGEYTYTVTYGTQNKTLKVTVEDDVLIVPSARSLQIESTALADYDFTELFSLYVDGAAVKVTEAMLDTSALANAEEGKDYSVSLSYDYHGTVKTQNTTVKVVAETPYTVTVKNYETYPHGATIDLTSLFEIKRGDETIPVTADMITGEVDYNVVGNEDSVSTITLHFNGTEYVATVTVKAGVVIGYANGDRVTVLAGTDKASYAFAKDFVVMIDGTRFRIIPENYFEDLDAVNFDEAGEYEVTLKIPYSNQRPTISGVRFTYVEKKITYVVTEIHSEIQLYNETVTLAKGTKSYNAFSNLSVSINGALQTLTTNPEWANPITATCYAEVLTEIDFASANVQEVRVAVYPSGPDGEPETVSFRLVIQSDIVITAESKGIFAGATVFTKDLFQITEDGNPVAVTYDMITGKVDSFTPGVYEITASYGGLSRKATVTVFDNAMKGVYHTRLTTIPVEEDDDDDDGEYGDYGDYGEGEYSLRAASTSNVFVLDDLIIAEDGSITVNGQRATVVGGIDERTLLIHFGSYDYTLYYENGIVVLDVDNSVKLAFGEYKRPLVYFNEEVWRIDEHVVINYGDQHVLQNTFPYYSIDTFKLVAVDGGAETWYGLKVHLVDKTSSDTVYAVTWGEVVYADDFAMKQGASSSLTFLGEEYRFVMQSRETGKISKNLSQNKYAGKSFSGKVDGQNASLRVSGGGTSESFELYVNNARVFHVGNFEMSNAKNSYVDYATDTVFLYNYETNRTQFSYKFKLDLTNNTFTVEERDMYYGKYETDTMFVYLDGYGTGVVNFNKVTFTYTRITYTVQKGIVTVRYVDVVPDFEYGQTAEFYIGEFLNVLTVKDFASFSGETFVNSIVTDGAIVEISSTTFGVSPQGRQNLLDAIRIVTKDGELQGDAKKNAVVTSTVSFSTPGYYQFTIDLTVNGQQVSARYAVQVLADAKPDETVYTTYGNGVMFPANSFSLDKYAHAILVCSGVRFEGIAAAQEDGSFIVKAFSESGALVVATGKPIASGLIQLTVTGAASFTDYFTTGTGRVCGINGYVLREFTVGAQKTYLVAPAVTATGEVVQAEIVSGDGGAGTVFRVTGAQGERLVQIVNWGRTTDGLILLENN